MKQHKSFPDPAMAHAILDEADIGSGERTAAQQETEELIRQIPPLPVSGTGDQRDRDESDQQTDTDDGSDFDAGEAIGRLEHAASLERDEPSEELDELDPVPPKG